MALVITVLLIGEPGCGKSYLGNLIVGKDVPYYEKPFPHSGDVVSVTDKTQVENTTIKYGNQCKVP